MFYRPYVPVARRHANAAKLAAKMAKGGKALQPLRIAGRKITTTFWGNAWCENLEAYSDFENRLPRGATYARNGSVIHLEISEGGITAMVMGSEVYHISIQLAPLAAAKWKILKKSSTGRITNLLDLIQGKLPADIISCLVAKDTGLFPSPREITMQCSCPDYAGLCKHLAAVMYGVGHRLDHDPSLFFTLRSLDMSELLSAAGTQATGLAVPEESELGNEDLSALFGVEMESAPVPATKAKAAKTAAKKVATKKTAAKTTTAKKAVRKTAKKAVRKTAVKAAKKTKRA